MPKQKMTCRSKTPNGKARGVFLSRKEVKYLHDLVMLMSDEKATRKAQNGARWQLERLVTNYGKRARIDEIELPYSQT